MKSILVLACILSTPLVPVFSMGGAPRPVTVMVVPAEPNMVRLGLDMVEREDVLLMSYAPASKPQDPFLHVWNGSEWLRVPSNRYADGSFLKRAPGTVLVVGGNDALTTILIEQAVDWSPEVLNVASGPVTDVINSLGRLFQFSRSDWKWFASEYNLKLENLNEGREEKGWYDSHSPSDIPQTPNPILKPFSKSEDVYEPSSNLETISVPPVSEPPVVEEPSAIEGEPIPEVVPEDFSIDVNEM